MKMKKEYIILLIAIVALSAYVIFRNPDRTHYELPKIHEITGGDISKMEISKEGTAIVLKKEGNEWHIGPEGYLADTHKVKNMLDGMENLAVTALVSESKNYSRYDLDDEKKITVRAWEGETLKRDFDVGKTASSFQHTFLRLSNDDRVYHGKGNLRQRYDQTVEGLRDNTVLSFDREEIQEIQITKVKDVLALNRIPAHVVVKTEGEDDGQASTSSEGETKTVWQTPDGKEGDETKLDRLLMTLSSLRCEKYIDDKKKEDFKEPLCTILLKGTEEYVLSIFQKGDKDSESYPATSSQNDYPFMLPKWQADNLMKQPDEMLKESDES
jgi:hypothetical protein